jgi:hypothetical protein
MLNDEYVCLLSLIEHLVLREDRHGKLRDWCHQERRTSLINDRLQYAEDWLFIYTNHRPKNEKYNAEIIRLHI